MSSEETIRRADRAHALLDDDVLAEAHEKARSALLTESIEADTVEKREMARAGVRVMDAIVTQLEIIRDQGTVAREALRRAQ